MKCLAFVPIKDVISAFKEISRISVEDFKPMLEYFEEFYIGTNYSRQTRRIPTYPIKMWNCYNRVLEDLDTTNNSLESWHKVFEMDCKKHPTIHKLVQHFRLEQKNTEMLIAQLESGDIYHRKKSEIDKKAKIREVL